MKDFLKQREERKASLAHRIEKQTLSVSAIHKVSVTAEDVARRLAADPNWTSLSMEYLLDITESLYLIDAATDDLGVIDVQLLNVTQDNEYGQAPWGERFFDATGTQLLDSPWPPPDAFTGPGHVRFSMHYFDPCQPLDFDDLFLTLPAPTPLPGWLADVMPYKPPN